MGREGWQWRGREWDFGGGGNEQSRESTQEALIVFAIFIYSTWKWVYKSELYSFPFLFICSEIGHKRARGLPRLDQLPRRFSKQFLWRMRGLRAAQNKRVSCFHSGTGSVTELLQFILWSLACLPQVERNLEAPLWQQNPPTLTRSPSATSWESKPL